MRKGTGSSFTTGVASAKASVAESRSIVAIRFMESGENLMLRDRWRNPRDEFLHAVHVFHRQPEEAAGLAEVVDGDDARVTESRKGTRFPREVFGQARIVIEAEIGRINMKFIGKDDLMRNKAAPGRPKDRIDLEELGKL